MAQTIQIRRGTGSAVPSSLAEGELAINVDSGKFYYGNGSAVSSDFRVDSITAENYIVCSSVSNITTQTLSGSTAFGDSADDTHQFIGNMRVTGFVSASNNVIASNLDLHDINAAIGFGTNDDKIYLASNSIIIAPDDTDILTVSDQGLNVQVEGDLKVTSHITASGNISASGIITAEQLTTTDDLTVGDDINLSTGGKIYFDGAGGSVYVDSSGNDLDLTANNNIDLNASQYVQIVAGNNPTLRMYTNDASVNTNNTIGLIEWQTADATDVRSAMIQVRATENHDDGNNAGGKLQFYTANADTENLVLTLDENKAATFTSHITASGDISASGNITANSIVGTVGTAAQTNITSVGTLGSLTVSGDITANGNIAGDNNTSVTGLKDVTLVRDLTVGRNISASGDITASNILTIGNAEIGGELHAARVYPNGPSGPFIDQVGDNLQFSTGIKTLTHITASGNISASGIIFTDTLSSPGNNLSIPSNTVTITAGTAGDANLILQSDTDDSNEADNPFMLLEQDGGAIRSIIGHAGANDEYPDATVFTGGLSNHLIIAHSGSGASRGMQFGTGNNARVTINTDGEVGIGTNNPTKTLDVTGEIRASSTITATSLAINTDGEGKANIISSQAVDLKIATTHASTNRDVGIELSGSGARYSLALDRANDTFVIASDTVGNAPNNAAFTLSATTASFSGQVIDGGRTLIKILPTDFVPDDGGRPMMVEDDNIGSDELFLHSHGSLSSYAYIEIPFGMTATHVKIFGSDTGQNFTVYEGNINTKTIAIKGSATAIGTLKDITDVPSTETNYLVILVESDGADDEIHGGFVTITSS